MKSTVGKENLHVTFRPTYKRYRDPLLGLQPVKILCQSLDVHKGWVIGTLQLGNL